MNEQQFRKQAEEWAAITVGEGTNIFLGYAYPSSEGAQEANMRLLKTFEDPHPGFGTQFGTAGKSLLVRVRNNAGYHLAISALGRPLHEQRLATGPRRGSSTLVSFSL